MGQSSKGPSTNIMRTLGVLCRELSIWSSTNILRTLGSISGLIDMVWAKYSLLGSLDCLGFV